MLLAAMSGMTAPIPNESRLDRALAGTFPASDPLPVGPRPAPLVLPRSEIVPGQRAPHLVLPTTAGTLYSLHEARPERFTMVVAYRGLHSPECRTYLRRLHRLAPRYAERGVELVAFSMDGLQRARSAQSGWDLPDLTIGYGASEDVVCRWGLFLSRSIQVGEPPRFCEPGLFLVRPDAVLHYASVQSMAFGRPDLELLLPSIDVLIEEDRPARGSVSVR